ncbi:MAG: hypothetical protein ACE5E1_05025 [Phycisphaerae bacterium]
MMHSSPMPLRTALDMAKRLHHELSKHMTVEQRRDFTRIERLISEAQRQHQAQMTRARDTAVSSLPASSRRPRKGWLTR